MINQDNIVLTRSEPGGNGGTQFIYRIDQYGIAAHSTAMEHISQIHWRVEIIKFRDKETLSYDICHTTKLADKTLIFRNDKSLNEFLEKAFDYFSELGVLEDMAKNVKS